MQDHKMPENGQDQVAKEVPNLTEKALEALIANLASQKEQNAKVEAKKRRITLISVAIPTILGLFTLSYTYYADRISREIAMKQQIAGRMEKKIDAKREIVDEFNKAMLNVREPRETARLMYCSSSSFSKKQTSLQEEIIRSTYELARVQLKIKDNFKNKLAYSVTKEFTLQTEKYKNICSTEAPLDSEAEERQSRINKILLQEIDHNEGTLNNFKKSIIK